MTAYDGQEISYDGCGNPVSYYDGSSFTWTQGRRLAGYANGDTDISYAYDMAGVRSRKTVGSTTYNFTTLSGLVTRQEWDGNSIDFVYDENNQPLAMKYNNTLYYYILNVQGDVIALADQNGTLIAKYTYDPWGKLLKVTPNGWLEEQNAYYLKVAEANPLRYRGYYYDSETGFYYLQSRYYDPAIGRFINADSYASTDAAGLLSTNMFAYCENDPINRSDPSGELADAVIGGLIGMTTNMITSYVAGNSLGEIIFDGAVGFATGLVNKNAITISVNAVMSLCNGIKTVIKCNSFGAGLAVFTLSFGASFVTGKNISNLFDGGISVLSQYVTDLTLGLGANMLAPNVAADMERNANKQANDPSSNIVAKPKSKLSRGHHYGSEWGLNWGAPR